MTDLTHRIAVAALASAALLQGVSAVAAPPRPVAKAATAPAGTLDASERAAVAWLDANAHPLANDMPTSAELAPIVERLKGKKLIGIGEMSHGTQQDQQFKIALVEELIERAGARLLVMELNGADGRAIGNQGQGHNARRAGVRCPPVAPCAMRSAPATPA